MKSKNRFMAAYSAGQSAYQNHAIYDMEPWGDGPVLPGWLS
ncbi:MAG TPA: hypothetical protein VIH67_03360 [Candidatus Acidoferrum sp.]